MFRTWFGIILAAALLLAQGQKMPPGTFTGTVHGVSKKRITIEKEDGNLVDFEINHKTRVMRNKKPIKPTDLATGDRVTIEAREEMLQFLVALTITAEPKTQDER